MNRVWNVIKELITGVCGIGMIITLLCIMAAGEADNWSLAFKYTAIFGACAVPIIIRSGCGDFQPTDEEFHENNLK